MADPFINKKVNIINQHHYCNINLLKSVPLNMYLIARSFDLDFKPFDEARPGYDIMEGKCPGQFFS